MGGAWQKPVDTSRDAPVGVAQPEERLAVGVAEVTAIIAHPKETMTIDRILS
jgi:hypothetical protein